MRILLVALLMTMRFQWSDGELKTELIIGWLETLGDHIGERKVFSESLEVKITSALRENARIINISLKDMLFLEILGLMMKEIRLLLLKNSELRVISGGTNSSRKLLVREMTQLKYFP